MLRKSDLLNPTAVLAAAGLVTWFCFGAVLRGILGSWAGGLVVASVVAFVILYGYWARTRTRRARDELRSILGPSSNPADYHRVYSVLRPLRHYDRRIQELLDLTDSYGVGILRWTEYRDEVLATMDDVVGQPFMTRRGR